LVRSFSCGCLARLLRLFLDDPDLDGGVDAAAELHLDLGEAEGLDGLLEVDLLGVDLDALGGQRLGDVARASQPAPR
jgi:hypothetical protein